MKRNTTLKTNKHKKNLNNTINQGLECSNKRIYILFK